MLFESFMDSLNEAEKGLMHKILNVPEDKEIGDVYKDGEDLAKSILIGVKKSKIVPLKDVRKKATSMIAFAANWPSKSGKNIFKKALSSIKKIEIPGVPLTDNK